MAMELIHKGIWKPEGVNGPEWFAPQPFLDLLAEYGSSWHIREEDTTGIEA
jgi:saccharopine dehydrogenase-like NADP-dependent oxidoreductase